MVVLFVMLHCSVYFIIIFFLIFRYLLNKVTDINELVKLDEETLTEILGNAKNAKLLYEFIHKKTLR